MRTFKVVPGILVMACCWLVAGSVEQAAGAGGSTIFEQLRCNACHKLAEKSVAVPVSEIAGVYKGAPKLVRFFKGESKPEIESEKAGMMKGQMQKLKDLSDEDKQALAEYIMGFYKPAP